ncbi:MAG: hypothetical protein AAGE65_03140 [Planctomycetota bacterium]
MLCSLWPKMPSVLEDRLIGDRVRDIAMRPRDVRTATTAIDKRSVGCGCKATLRRLEALRRALAAV